MEHKNAEVDLLEFVKSAGHPVRRGDVARALGISPDAVTKHINYLVDLGILKRVGNGAQAAYRIVQGYSGTEEAKSKVTDAIGRLSELQGVLDRWETAGAVTAVKYGDLDNEIVRYVREANGPVSSGKIAKAFGANRYTIGRHVQYLLREGRLVMSSNAQYPMYSLPDRVIEAPTGEKDLESLEKRLFERVERLIDRKIAEVIGRKDK